MIRALGYIPDPENPNDWRHASLLPPKGLMSSRLENLDMVKSTVVLDQGSIGSCVVNAGLNAFHTKHVLDGYQAPPLGARLPAYYLLRSFIGTQKEDSGGHIRDFFRGVNHYGFSTEEKYPYDVNRFREEPPPEYFSHAFDQRDPAEYFRIEVVGNLELGTELRFSIDNNNPIVCGGYVSNAFLNWSGPVTEAAPVFTGTVAGGHAWAIMGYDRLGLRCVNSWGLYWGDHGWFTVGWRDVGYLVDIWSVRRVPWFSDLEVNRV